MSLAGNVDALADRLADEFNDVRTEVTASLAGKSASTHNHDSAYVNATGDTVSGVLTFTDMQNLRYSPSSTKVVSVDTSAYAQSPIGSVLWHDLLRFNREWDALVVEKNLGGTWTPSTDAALTKHLFSGKQQVSHHVARPGDATPWTGTRWTWDAIQYSDPRWLCIGWGWSSGAAWQILAETSADGVAWTQLHLGTSSVSAAPTFHYATYLNGDHRYYRVTVTSTSTANLLMSSMQVLGSRWGDQGGGVERTFPYEWDADARIGIGGPPSTTTGNNLRVTGTIEVSGGKVVGLNAPTAGSDATTKTYVDTGLAGKASTSHAHPITDVTGLQGSLNSKASTTHTHDDRYYTESEVDSALAGKSSTEHTHAAAGSDYTRAADHGWSTSAAPEANDTAIANAIAAARAGNRRLYLGAGTYDISVPIDLKAFVGEGDCIEIFGDTRSETVINQTTATADVMQAGGYSGYIHDMELRHSEAAFAATPATLGAGLSMYKLAYSTVERLQITNNGRGIRIADAEVPNPGGSTGGGNYFHSVSFTDCFILRYGVSGISLDVEGAVSTGSSFRGIWIQNQDTNGESVSATGHALTLYLCDEMSFTQLNIEDGASNMPVLINSCGAIMFESLHFERIHLTGGDPQYVRVAGGSQLVVDGVTFAFSDVARAGATGTSHYFTAVTGGKLDLRGITIKNMDNTAARPLTLCELDDSTEGSSMDVRMPSGGDVDELTALTNTPITNPGYVRVGNQLGPAAMPRVVSPVLSGTGTGPIATDALLSGNNRDYTATGDVTIQVPTNGVNGQVIQYCILASGAARNVTIASGIQRLTGVNATYAVPSAKVFRVSLRYSGLSAAWLAEAAAVQQ